MTTEVVGNAQVFVVVRDIKTGKEYGYHVEVRNPMMSTSSCDIDTPYFSLDGTVVSADFVELEEMRNMLNS